MPTTNNNRQAYVANISLAFDYNNEREYIPKEQISYIMIEHDFDNQVLPVIFISVAVDSQLYTKIVKYQKSAKFYLDITKTNKYSNNSVTKQVLKGTFNYIPSTTNPNYTENLSVDEGDSYKGIMIGLVSMDLTNSLRKSYNSVYNDVDTNTLIAVAIEGTDCIIERPTYNTTYQSIIIPPIASRYKLLEHIFDLDPFYDTYFRYFMDFHNSYLVSKRGDPVLGKDDDPTSIILDVKAVTEDDAYYDGMEIKNGAYYVNINPVNCNVVVNEGTEKVANELVAVDEDNPTRFMDLNINNSEGSSTKRMFMRTEHPALYKNEMEVNTVLTEVIKPHIDGEIFTPNKSIYVNNYGEYSKYNGKYIMMYKREFFKCVAGEFVMSCNLGLRKVNNIEPLDRSVDIHTTTAGRNSARRKSTANKSNTSRNASRTLS